MYKTTSLVFLRISDHEVQKDQIESVNDRGPAVRLHAEHLNYDYLMTQATMTLLNMTPAVGLGLCSVFMYVSHTV